MWAWSREQAATRGLQAGDAVRSLQPASSQLMHIQQRNKLKGLHWGAITPVQNVGNCQITYFLSFFWPHRAACGIFVPQPGIEPTPLALEAQSLNHWTAREVPGQPVFFQPINCKETKEVGEGGRPLEQWFSKWVPNGPIGETPTARPTLLPTQPQWSGPRGSDAAQG